MNGDIDDAEIMRRANIIYFRSRAYSHVSWMGVPALKCPMDLWLYQELICRGQVDLLIETGTAAGGSALFFAHLFDQLGRGTVLSIDVRADESRPEHPRINYVHASSLSKSALDRVRRHADGATSTLIILDSNHRTSFKLLELAAYAPFVTLGSYLVAEDSGFDHYPSFPEYGPGPAKAVAAFLQNHPQFMADRTAEKHMLTFAPCAFLKRIACD